MYNFSHIWIHKPLCLVSHDMHFTLLSMSTKQRLNTQICDLVCMACMHDYRQQYKFFYFFYKFIFLVTLSVSHQRCAPGYYRDTKGLFLGKCVPCNCNGHSDQCLDGSGICLVSSFQLHKSSPFSKKLHFITTELLRYVHTFPSLLYIFILFLIKTVTEEKKLMQFYETILPRYSYIIDGAV